MPGKGGSGGGKFKLTKDFGPPRLRKVHQELAAGINRSWPKKGNGIAADEYPDGVQISIETPANPNQDDGGSGGGGSGTPVNLYGALNGAPAIFHLLQSSAPTPA